MQSWTNAVEQRRTAVRSEFTAGTNTLVSSWFGFSVGLDSSFRLLVGVGLAVFY